MIFGYLYFFCDLPLPIFSFGRFLFFLLVCFSGVLYVLWSFVFSVTKKLKSIVRTLIFLSFYFYIFILVCFGLIYVFSWDKEKCVFL